MILKIQDNVRKSVALTMVTVILVLLSTRASAQIPVPVTISGTESASACISLSKGSSDTDIIVKFSFDEPNNNLIVSLVSYRSLFVFNENVKFSDVFSFGALRPKKLPYEVKVPKKGKFKATSEFRKSLRQGSGLKNHREYIFSRWIDYDGLQPVPCEYSMVNDRIEQIFSIKGDKSAVSITLKDIAIVDPCRKEGRYKFMIDRNVNKTFDITIKRDPCFDKQEELKSAQDALAAVTAAYDSLKFIYDDGIAPNISSYDLFTGLQADIVGQFTKMEEESECDCLKERRVSYNNYLDSISAMEYKKPAILEKGVVPKGINANQMMSRVHTIDNAIGRWLNSSDPIERRDLEKKCEKLIETSKNEVAENGLLNQEQHDAWNMMRKAEIYYKTTCGK